MATEAIIDEVASNLEEAAAATRSVNPKMVGLFLGGVALGAALGFFAGYRFDREKLRKEAFEESEAEVDKIREIYEQKTIANQPKPSVEELIEEKGYGVVEHDPIPQVRPLRPPVPVVEPEPVEVVETEHVDNWDWELERKSRDIRFPYVIHQDEFFEMDEGEYSKVTYTYYRDDDVLTDEDYTPLPHADIIVGTDNLKFGHGTDDPNVVFVRNDERKLLMEICQIPLSYEEEVLGHGSREPTDE